MRVVFMGTPDFAVGTLKAIIEAGHDVAAVVTQPDKPRGRSKSLVFSPVKEEAVAHGITVLQPERARDDKDLIKRFSESFDATIDTMINLCEANN